MLHDNRCNKRYEKRFILFSSKVEKAIVRLIAVFVLMLLASQVLLQSPAVRSAIVKVEQLEGTPYRRF